MPAGRVLDQRLKDCPVHILKFLNVQASLSGRVFSEFSQEGFCLTMGQHAVQNNGGLTR